jgi:hypothetical protein
MVLASGTHVGTYEITDAIGAGGMREVYRAHDPELGRDVAIKVAWLVSSVRSRSLNLYLSVRVLGPAPQLRAMRLISAGGAMRSASGQLVQLAS